MALAEEMLTVEIGPTDRVGGRGRLFLCHNSIDKPIIRDVAEAVELEYGVQNFLDVYSIPAGAEFIPYIEKELSQCSGCAIFLGGSGWGPTHLWEADRAVARYRQDQDFKIIPVALPGITQGAMDRLAGGSVFRNLNWVDFTKSPRDPDNVRKLYGALTGVTDEQGLARRGLTPFILRRDARRWHERGGRDSSLLYMGDKLREAQALLVSASDLLDVGEVATFLNAGELRQRRFWQRVAGASVAAAVALLIAAGIAWVQADIATHRQHLAVSRMLAIGAESARGADRQLLAAAAAVSTFPTPEARSNLLDRLSHWSSLVAMLHTKGHEFTAAAYDEESGALMLGTFDGSVLRVPLQVTSDAGQISTLGTPEVVSTTLGEGEVGALLVQRASTVLAGFQSGRVDAIGANGASRTLREAPTPVQGEGGGIKDRAVRALALSPSRNRLAIGDGRGWVEIVSTIEKSGLPSQKLDLTDRLRITSLAFVGESALAVGTASSTIEIINLLTGKWDDSLPKQEMSVVALSHRANGNLLMAVTDQGVMRTLGLDAGRRIIMNGPGTNRAEAPPAIAAARIAPSSGRMALAYADGYMELRDNAGAPVLDRLQPHRDVIGAFAFAEKQDLLISAGRDGIVAAWRQNERAAVAQPHAHFPGLPDMLAIDRVGTLHVARKDESGAQISRLSGGNWQSVLDLGESSRALLPADRIEPSRKPNGEGFVDISAEAIPHLQIAPDSGLALWSTYGNAVLSQRWDGRPATLYALPASKITALALTPSGTLGAVLSDERRVHLLAPVRADAMPMRTIDLPEAARSIALSNNARYLAVGTDMGRLLLYDLRLPGSRPTTRAVTSGALTAISFSPDGRLVVVLAATGWREQRALAAVDVPDLAGVDYLPIPDKLVGVVNSPAISPDSSTLAAPDLGGNVMLWELATKRSIGSIHIDGSQVASIAYRSDGTLFASVTTGENIVSLEVTAAALIAQGCRLAARDLSAEEWNDLATGLRYRQVCPPGAAK